jgi:hypothetical protein
MHLCFAFLHRLRDVLLVEIDLRENIQLGCTIIERVTSSMNHSHFSMAD